MLVSLVLVNQWVLMIYHVYLIYTSKLLFKIYELNIKLYNLTFFSRKCRKVYHPVCVGNDVPVFDDVQS